MNIISETVRKNILRPQEGWMGKEWHCQLVTSVRTQREEPHTQAGKSAVSALVQGVLPDTFKSAISTPSFVWRELKEVGGAWGWRMVTADCYCVLNCCVYQKTRWRHGESEEGAGALNRWRWGLKQPADKRLWTPGYSASLRLALSLGSTCYILLHSLSQESNNHAQVRMCLSQFWNFQVPC